MYNQYIHCLLTQETIWGNNVLLWVNSVVISKSKIKKYEVMTWDHDKMKPEMVMLY
jgi:hypothetical protein